MWLRRAAIPFVCPGLYVYLFRHLPLFSLEIHIITYIYKCTKCIKCVCVCVNEMNVLMEMREGKIFAAYHCIVILHSLEIHYMNIFNIM